MIIPLVKLQSMKGGFLQVKNESCCTTPEEPMGISITPKVTECGCSTDACAGMMDAIATTAQMTGFVSPEVRALFDEWASQLSGEILDWIGNYRQVEPKSIARQFKISEEAAVYFITRLIRDRKIRVTGIEVLS